MISTPEEASAEVATARPQTAPLEKTAIPSALAGEDGISDEQNAPVDTTAQPAGAPAPAEPVSLEISGDLFRLLAARLNETNGRAADDRDVRTFVEAAVAAALAPRR